jgi:hypothetical protein
MSAGLSLQSGPGVVLGPTRARHFHCLMSLVRVDYHWIGHTYKDKCLT